MENSYKLVITYGETYREAELPDEDISMRIGSTVRCDIRIAYELGKEPFEMEISRQHGVWILECQDGVYFTTGGVRKQIRKELEHDDKLAIFLEKSNVEICYINFLLDFDRVEKKYDRVIDIHGERSVVIGGTSNAAIFIKNDLVGTDSIALVRRSGKLFLTDHNARYGAYINGIRVQGEQELHDTDFFSLVGYSFYYSDGRLYTDSSNGVSFRGLKAGKPSVQSGGTEYPRFVRNVRNKIVLNTDPITVLDPPAKPQKPKDNIFMQILPALGSIILVVVLRGLMGGGGTFVVFSACSMGLGIITSIISFVTGKKDYKKEMNARETEYQDYIKRKESEIQSARQTEARQLASIYWPLNKELKLIQEFSGDLFDRQIGDEDFLRVNIGNGKQEAKRAIRITEKETITISDELAKIPAMLRDKYRYLNNAPIFLDLKNDNAVGVVGDRDSLYEIMKIMTLDLCTRQYYNDVRLAYIFGEDDMDRASWIRWLPYISNDTLGMRNIVCDSESRNTLFEYLYVELMAREQQKSEYPYFVVFVMDDNGLKSHPMSKFVEKAKDYGFTFIFFEARQDLLPQGCDEIVSLTRGKLRGNLSQVKNINTTVEFSYQPVKDEQILNSSIILSPVYSEEVSLENTLTKNITLYELLGIVSPGDIDLSDNWKRAAVYRSMAAPLGVKSKSETVYLDLHEKAHGPHGLVAGTTGSGKSELLQSYIISMAILYHPYEVSFVIIDFKGGGMANQFRDLPHLVGAITNIDGAAIQRSLKSIKAELQKRQRLFAEADVNKIDDYLQLYKNGIVEVPLPHLIIVVDEFAELKAQQPEFMDELISAARIGRSLGVHLILATQKPSGQVNEQIWSNSRFQLCLKVATPQDSNEVIKSPLAAEIREPGRAYLRVGNNEIFELFQSAYSGGPSATDISGVRTFSINELNVLGRKSPVFEQKRIRDNQQTETQLDAVVSYIAGYCETNGILKQPDICLPDLPDVLNFQLPTVEDNDSAIVSVIGLYDDPDNQYQGPVTLDFTTENTILIGSSQMGKTNLLQVVIRALAERYSPSEVSLYIIDFGSMILKNFEEMAHVGGVVCSMEDEKLKNLFKLLNEEIETRKRRMMEIGVSSFSSYKMAGYQDLPQIVLLIDNYTALKELYFQEDDPLLPILRDGISMGISVVLSNSQTSGISFKYTTNFSRKISLYCNDSSEYTSTMGSRPAITPRSQAGKAIVNIDNSVFEMQTFLSFPGEIEIDRVNNMRLFVSDINQRYGSQRARRIPVVPSVLDEDIFTTDFSINRQKTYAVPIGLKYDPVEVFSFDLLNTSVIGLMGGKPSERENLISVIANQLDRNIFSCPAEVYVIDDIQHSLKWLNELGITKEYTANPNAILELLEQISERIKERFDAVVADGLDVLQTEPLLILLIQNRDAINILGKDAGSLAIYKEMLGTYRSMKFCVFFTNLEDAAVPFSASEILKMIKETRGFIYFNKLSNIKFIDVPMAVVRRFKKELEENDAFWIGSEGIEKIKIVKS